MRAPSEIPFIYLFLNKILHANVNQCTDSVSNWNYFDLVMAKESSHNSSLSAHSMHTYLSLRVIDKRRQTMTRIDHIIRRRH